MMSAVVESSDFRLERKIQMSSSVRYSCFGQSPLYYDCFFQMYMEVLAGEK